MKINVTRHANREVSFTNKAAAYYFTQTHETIHPEYAEFEGLNVAKNRIFGGYRLFWADQLLDNRTADVTVYPYKLVRQHAAGVGEELWLLDNKNLLDITLTDPAGPVGIELRNVSFQHQRGDVAFFAPQEGAGALAVAARQRQPLTQTGQRLTATGGGFLVAWGADETEATALIREGQQAGPALKAARQARMEAYLQTYVCTASSDESLDEALRWLATTLDQLVTRQHGAGIYAGLPWFNEYWGRDEFIALPGATLVTGQFATAREILLAFARYQQSDPASRFYGRIPNIVNPSGVDYHTVDGTPRFVVALHDYLRYSGDTALLTQLYPQVQCSIEGALQHWVDAKGYLRHADNETWMDARDPAKVPYTPRGTRANDVQALWYQQLRTGAQLAALRHDAANQRKWTTLAEQVRTNFERDYRAASPDYLADRLDEHDQADFVLRPNQLFALDLLADDEYKWHLLRHTWQTLVYPWGVASLDQADPEFHPYHWAPERYPKDAAYHRGTVWLWNNGIALQRMLEAEQVETAYQLFANLNRQALTAGVVGGLGENMDAYPTPGTAWPRLTGAYLQAWSNAEQLRVWYQYFLGIRPDLLTNTLTLAPRLPAVLRHLAYTCHVRGGRVKGSYQATPTPLFTYHFEQLTTTATFDAAAFAPVAVAIQPDTVLTCEVTPEALLLTLRDPAGRILFQHSAPDAERLAQLQIKNDILNGVSFATPQPQKHRNTLVMSQK